MAVTAKDIELADEGLRLLRSHAKGKVRFGVGSSKPVDLPKPAREMLEKTLKFLAEGESVLVMPESVELTTQQAADLLKVSRPFVVNLLEKGELPFRRVGKHRRVLAVDVLAYKQAIDEKRLSTLKKLAGEAQELGLGY